MSWWMESGSRRALRASTLAVALCALLACGKEPPAPAGGPGGEGAAPAPSSQAPAQAVSSKVAGMGADALRAAANKALAEQRLYAPAGDNAMEYYVALRDKAPTEAAVSSALTDLMPYTLIATEQSIAREDFAEAQRLYALMQKADPQAPALPRLKQGIADGQAALAQRTADAEAASQEEAQRQAELERQRQAEQQRAQQQAAQQLAQQQAAQPAPAPAASAPAAGAAPQSQAPAQAQPAAQREARQPAEGQSDPDAPAQRQARQPAPEPAPAAPAPAPASAAPKPAPLTLRAISTPSPAYPTNALREGRSGEVVVEFTVNPDGSVSNPRVVRADPPRTFDRAALNAVRRWRFQPVAEPTTTRRTIGFKPG